MRRALCALLLSLLAGTASPGQRDAEKDAPKEDPEVAAYARKKGWRLFRDTRIFDRKPMVYLGVTSKEDDRPLPAEDVKMIVRSKTVEMLDLRAVRCDDAALKAFAGMPRLQGIIANGDDVTDAGVKALAKCKTLDSVTLFTKKVTDEGVKELGALPKLKMLYLFGLTMSGSAFEAFAGSKSLEHVYLEYVDGLTDDGVKHLGKLPKLNTLKVGTGFGEKKLTAAGIKAVVEQRLPATFEFDRKLIDDDLLAALVQKGWLYGPTPEGATEKKPAKASDVRVIVLSGSKVTDRGMRAVLDCTNVTTLFLDNTAVTDETLEAVAAFKKLDYLALENTKVTAAGLEAVSSLPIKHVAMQRCEMTEDSFKALAKMAGLEELWLSDAKMKGDWLKHLAKQPRLKDLNLTGVDFDDAAAKHVATMPALESLVLNNTKLGDRGFQELVKVPKLRSFLVDGTKVSKEVYLKAKKDRPKLRLYYYRYDS